MSWSSMILLNPVEMFIAAGLAATETSGLMSLISVEISQVNQMADSCAPAKMLGAVAVAKVVRPCDAPLRVGFRKKIGFIDSGSCTCKCCSNRCWGCLSTYRANSSLESLCGVVDKKCGSAFSVFNRRLVNTHVQILGMDRSRIGALSHKVMRSALCLGLPCMGSLVSVIRPSAHSRCSRPLLGSGGEWTSRFFAAESATSY